MTKSACLMWIWRPSWVKISVIHKYCTNYRYPTHIDITWVQGAFLIVMCTQSLNKGSLKHMLRHTSPKSKQVTTARTHWAGCGVVSRSGKLHNTTEAHDKEMRAHKLSSVFSNISRDIHLESGGINLVFLDRPVKHHWASIKKEVYYTLYIRIEHIQ